MDEDDIYLWTKISTALAAEAAALCFGVGSHSEIAFDGLQQKLENWSIKKPVAFTPIYYDERDPTEGRFFPDVRFALDTCREFRISSSFKLKIN